MRMLERKERTAAVRLGEISKRAREEYEDKQQREEDRLVALGGSRKRCAGGAGGGLGHGARASLAA